MSLVVARLRLLLDIFSIKVFVWMFGRNDELLDSHLFFFDKYSDLADYHRGRGRIEKADRLLAIAEAHFRLAPDDGDPPKAAAMAMPAPPPRIRTNAVGAARVKSPSNEDTNLASVSKRRPSEHRTAHAGATSTLWQWSSFR
jgi:hypothetical protein